jgi:hypothetical protein
MAGELDVSVEFGVMHRFRLIIARRIELELIGLGKLKIQKGIGYVSGWAGSDRSR